MNLTGFDKTKELSDAIQSVTEGEVVSNQLGTENIATPIEGNDHIEQFNKGADALSKFIDYTI